MKPLPNTKYIKVCIIRRFVNIFHIKIMKIINTLNSKTCASSHDIGMPATVTQNKAHIPISNADQFPVLRNDVQHGYDLTGHPVLHEKHLTDEQARLYKCLITKFLSGSSKLFEILAHKHVTLRTERKNDIMKLNSLCFQLSPVSARALIHPTH